MTTAAILAPHPAHTALERPLARAILSHALLAGVAADALFRDGPVGLAFPLWVGIVALALVSLGWRADRAIPTEVRAWLATAVTFSIGLAWRDAPLLQLADCAISLAALCMAAVAFARPDAALFAPRFRDTVQSLLGVVRATIAGVLPVAWRALDSERGDAPRQDAWPVARAAGVALILVIVFGALLRGADPVFASLVALPDFEIGELVSHLVVTAIFAWGISGWARGALAPAPTRPLPGRLPFELGTLDITAALGALNALFAIFLLTQLGWFFGGEAFLRERTGLTAAEYARQGFFQMVLVVLLVVPLLMATRAALQPGYALARRHTLLSMPLLGLLALMIASAMSRMQLYVQYYGFTIDRFYPLVLMVWLCLVLAWFAVTVLRDRDRAFVGGAVLSGLAVVALLNVVSPDRIVARANLRRATTAAPEGTYRTDRAYLAGLSGEASALALEATLAPPVFPVGSPSRRAETIDRCRAATNLLQRWGPGSRRAVDRERAGAWRTWNAGEREALRAVHANAARLRTQIHETCKVEWGGRS